MKTRLQGTCAFDLATVSLANIGDAHGFALTEGPFFRMERGNQTLATAMAEALPEVRTGFAVDTIEIADDEVIVRSGPHEERADAVVLAVPAPIAARVRFLPGLPDELAVALAELPMGDASKFAVATKQVPPDPVAAVERAADVVLERERRRRSRAPLRRVVRWFVGRTAGARCARGTGRARGSTRSPR